MGYTSTPLPKAIESLHPHFLGIRRVGHVIKKIRDMSHNDIVIEMDGCFLDLIDWIFHHWQGGLLVSVNNLIVLDKHFGIEKELCTIVINAEGADDSVPGDPPDGTQRKPEPEVRIGARHQNNKPREWQMRVPPDSMMHPQSSYRTAIYDFQNPLETYNASLDAREKGLAEKYAREIVWSIVNLPVSPSQSALGFKVSRESKTKLGWWLHKTPTILQKNHGEIPTRMLYTGLNDRPSDSRARTADDVIRMYPELLAGLNLVKDRCFCGCNERRAGQPLGWPEPDSGCLLSIMLFQMILLIGHALAEGLGAVSVSQLSGEQGTRDIVDAVMTVLERIAANGAIYWSSWFSLACTIIGGVSKMRINGAFDPQLETSDSRGSDLLWVIGDMTIAPKWLTLGAPIQLRGSWAVQQLTGKVAGVESEVAIVQSHVTTKAKFDGPPPPLVEASEGQDPGEVKLEQVVFSNANDVYRIACIVQAGPALRIFEPRDVYKGLINAVEPECNHPRSAVAEISAHKLSDVILRWNRRDMNLSHIPGPGSAAWIALLGESPLKQNIAIALSAGVCVLSRGNCCMMCLAEQCLARTDGQQWFGIYCGDLSPSRQLIQY
jgi:hypothetical protein